MNIRKLAEELQIDPVAAVRLEAAIEQERLRLHDQQAAGIALAKARGVRFGRPRVDIGDIAALYARYTRGQITLEEGARLCGVSRSTMYRRLREYEQPPDSGGIA